MNRFWSYIWWQISVQFSILCYTFQLQQISNSIFWDCYDHLSSFLVVQSKEVANINGEKVENASEEEESEEVESEEEDRQQPAEGPVSAMQEATSEAISQVGTWNGFYLLSILSWHHTYHFCHQFWWDGLITNMSGARIQWNVSLSFLRWAYWQLEKGPDIEYKRQQLNFPPSIIVWWDCVCRVLKGGVELCFLFPVEVGDEPESEESGEEEGEEEGTESDLVRPTSCSTQPLWSAVTAYVFFLHWLSITYCLFLKWSICLRAQSPVWRRGWRRKRKQTARGSGHPGKGRGG